MASGLIYLAPSRWFVIVLDWIPATHWSAPMQRSGSQNETVTRQIKTEDWLFCFYSMNKRFLSLWATPRTTSPSSPFHIATPLMRGNREPLGINTPVIHPLLCNHYDKPESIFRCPKIQYRRNGIVPLILLSAAMQLVLYDLSHPVSLCEEINQIQSHSLRSTHAKLHLRTWQLKEKLDLCNAHTVTFCFRTARPVGWKCGRPSCSSLPLQSWCPPEKKVERQLSSSSANLREDA